MRSFKSILAIGLTLAPVVSRASTRTAFRVKFTNCSEIVGSGAAPLAVVQTLVPAGYTLAETPDGQAVLSVRMTSCAEAKVDRTKSIPTTLAQIGVGVTSPDGTGFANTYTLIYVSNNPYLVQAFRTAGVPARFDTSIAYNHTLGSDGKAGTFYGAAQHAGVPAFFFFGATTEPPPNSSELFTSNWWYGTDQGVKQASTFPAISIGGSAISAYTSLASPLSLLFGGNSDSSFSIYNLYNEYPAATMVVIVKEH